jgi:hypothetical protein
MSMPFNVITLTGTVFAFIIGTVFNVTVRKGGTSIKEKLEGKKDDELPSGFRGKLKAKLRRLLSLITRTPPKEKSE